MKLYFPKDEQSCLNLVRFLEASGVTVEVSDYLDGLYTIRYVEDVSRTDMEALSALCDKYPESEALCQDISRKVLGRDLVRVDDSQRDRFLMLSPEPDFDGGMMPVLSEEGTLLNIGCGSKSYPGYKNVDVFFAPWIHFVAEMYDLPFDDGSISGIFSSHALEHVGWELVHKTIREWHRVLRPDGFLHLRMPDLEMCLKEYLESEDYFRRQFLKFAIYGLQRALSDEPDEAQYHRSGFSLKEMCAYLEQRGFVVERSCNYPGYGTPSLEILARKGA